MIKNYEEYKQYRSRLLTRGISVEESAKLKKEMGQFRKTHPRMFDEFRRRTMTGSL